MSSVELSGSEWSWEHGLAIPLTKDVEQIRNLISTIVVQSSFFKTPGTISNIILMSVFICIFLCSAVSPF